MIDTNILIHVHTYRYFHVIGGGQDLHWQEIESQRGEYVLAHNGWVMNADPLVNFASKGSQVKIQTNEVIFTTSKHVCIDLVTE